MGKLEKINSIYNPIQPIKNEQIISRRFPPKPVLRPYIFCYWVYYGDFPLNSPFSLSSIPDGCTDLYFDCVNYSGLNFSGIYDRQDENSGFISGKFMLFGINFLPGMFHKFFNHPMKEFKNSASSLELLVGSSVNELSQRLFEAKDIETKIEISEKFLLKRLEKLDLAEDGRYLTALNDIYKNNGLIKLNELIKNDSNQRHLRRVFDANIGLSPKAFGNIIRFQSLMRELVKTERVDWSDLYYKYGYYDQAHFINEFKKRVGKPPSKIEFN